MILSNIGSIQNLTETNHLAFGDPKITVTSPIYVNNQSNCQLPHLQVQPKIFLMENKNNTFWSPKVQQTSPKTASKAKSKIKKEKHFYRERKSYVPNLPPL